MGADWTEPVVLIDRCGEDAPEGVWTLALTTTTGLDPTEEGTTEIVRNPGRIFFTETDSEDEVEMVEADALCSLTAENPWYWGAVSDDSDDEEVLYLFCGEGGCDSVWSQVRWADYFAMEVSDYAASVDEDAVSVDHLVVEDLDLRGGSYVTMMVHASSGLILRRNNIGRNAHLEDDPCSGVCL